MKKLSACARSSAYRATVWSASVENTDHSTEMCNGRAPSNADDAPRQGNARLFGRLLVYP
jgi:hypothetical protein